VPRVSGEYAVAFSTPEGAVVIDRERRARSWPRLGAEFFKGLYSTSPPPGSVTVRRKVFVHLLDSVRTAYELERSLRELIRRQRLDTDRGPHTLVKRARRGSRP